MQNNIRHQENEELNIEVTQEGKNNQKEKPVILDTTNDVVSKVEAQKQISDIFGSTAEKVGASQLLATLVLFPYRVLTWFIKLLGILLIPYQAIKDYTKEIFPIAFALGIVFILLINGVYISIENIDGLLFENTFIPFVGWGIQIFLISILLGTIIQSYRHFRKNRVNDGTAIEIFSQGKLTGRGAMRMLSYVATIIILVILPIILALSSNKVGTNLIQVSASSLFGYVSYLIYMFVVSVCLFNIFKRTLYGIFAVMDREFPVFKKQVIEIAFSLIIIIALNSFLTIKFLIF